LAFPAIPGIVTTINVNPASPESNSKKYLAFSDNADYMDATARDCIDCSN
jgi:hypothetical protein